MSVEAGVLDANVLVYAMDANSQQCEASRRLLDAARDPAVTLYLTPQIICEFYSVVTNVRRVAAPCSPAEGLLAISTVLALPGIRVLPVPVDAVFRMIRLLELRPVVNGDVFDLHLIATMLANNVHRIYTFNTEDFSIFSELEVLIPRL